MRKLSTLENGLRVVTHKMPSFESVTFGIWNNVGSRDEEEKINGTAHFLEHMAFKGTKTKTAKQIAEKIDNVGGYINAYTSEETTAYFVKLLEHDLDVGIDVLSDILQNSTFDSKELEKERGVILQEIGMYLDDPSEMVGDYWQRTAFPNQALGRLIIGKKEIIQSIEREKIINFMQNNYHPSKMIVSAAGNIDHDKFVEKITSSMKNLPKGNLKHREKAKYQGGEYRENKKLEQIHLILGFQGLDFYDEDYYALSIYSAIMGAGMSSRLFQEIREKRGLVYSIYSSARSFYDAGIFQVVAGTGKNEIAELLPVLCDELVNAPKNLTEKEIEKSKTQLKTATLLSSESPMSNAAISVHQLFTHGKLIDVKDIIEKINNVTKTSIEKIANKVLSTEPTVASIGPIQKLEDLDKIRNRLNLS
tara:strand:- start:3594 stop:4853 length:1260 start_codon:yes stop_codon:yes gene_type:complete